MSENQADFVRIHDRERRRWITLPVPCVVRHAIDEDGTGSVLLMAPFEAGDNPAAASRSGADGPSAAADQQPNRVEKIP